MLPRPQSARRPPLPPKGTAAPGATGGGGEGGTLTEKNTFFFLKFLNQTISARWADTEPSSTAEMGAWLSRKSQLRRLEKFSVTW